MTEKCGHLGAELTEEDFYEQSFDRLDFRGATLEEKQFESCAFRGCNFSGTSFQRCRFFECIFEQCDLSNLKLRDSNLRRIRFTACKLMGINWTNVASLMHPSFEDCVLSYGSFLGLDLRKSRLRNCVAKETDFADAKLGEADCRRTDFTAARFARTDLVKADFRGAKNYTIRPDDNKIRKAKFSLPEATLLLYGLDIELEE
jgi:fluoroquinolone resistance protein